MLSNLMQISRDWADLVKRARSKQLKPDEYNSGNFTISNLGMFGVDTFDAILPPGASSQRKALCTSFISPNLYLRTARKLRPVSALIQWLVYVSSASPIAIPC